MSSSKQPIWLQDYKALNEITTHHLFLPHNLGKLSSLADESSLHRGIKQFLYWKGQLLPSLTKTTVFLAFLGPQGLTLPNVLNVAKALRSTCEFSKLQETYNGANSNFLAFTFSEEKAVHDIIANFHFFENYVVLPVAYCGEQAHRFRLLWLPPMFDVARVHHLLSGFTLSHRLKRESINLGEGQFSPSNVVSGTLTLKPGDTLDSLPHLLRLPSPHKGCALLYLPSRPPLCLKCRAVGHTRKGCPMTRCATCSKVHFPSATCGTSSYASVATKGITNCLEDDWFGHLIDDTDENSSTIHANLDTASVIPMTDLRQMSVTPITQPISSTVSDNSKDVHHCSADDCKKCDRTLRISSNDADCNTHHDKVSLDPLPHHNNTHDLLSSTDPTGTTSSLTAIFSANICSTLSHDLSLDCIAQSPPVTRSRSSHHKRQALSEARHTLRSETIHYSPFANKPPRIKTSDNSIIPSSFPDTAKVPSTHHMDSGNVSDSADLSDISVEVNLKKKRNILERPSALNKANITDNSEI